MATKRAKKSGTSLCRKGPSVGILGGSEPKPSRQRRKTPRQEQVSRQFVRIDLHRRRSVIVRLDQAGNVLGRVRVDNDPVEFVLAGPSRGLEPSPSRGRSVEKALRWPWKRRTATTGCSATTWPCYAAPLR